MNTRFLIFIAILSASVFMSCQKGPTTSFPESEEEVTVVDGTIVHPVNGLTSITWQDFRDVIVSNTTTTQHQQGGPIANCDSMQVLGVVNETILPTSHSTGNGTNVIDYPYLWLIEIPDVDPAYGPVYEVATVFGKLRRVEIGDLHTQCGVYQQKNQPAVVQVYKNSERQLLAEWNATIQVQWKLGEPEEVGKVSIVKIFLR